MCGIFFFASPTRRLRDGECDAALAAMHARGPDSRHWQRFGDCVLGHTRLAIIDPRPEADQPFASADGRHVIAFNGEIYNYRELRGELAAAGRRLRTASDTEVLLEAILHYGWRKALQRVRGMFAFVLLEPETGSFLLARDHFGQKPLHYTAAAGGFAAASNVNALLGLLPSVQPHLPAYSVYMSPAGDTGTRGAFMPDQTFFESVRTLPAGHVLVGDRDGTRIERYFTPHDLFDLGAYRRNCSREPDDLLAELDHLLDQAARRHLVSDQPVGVLLSGGIDSSLVYWYAARHTGALTNFAKISPGIEQLPMEVVPELLKRRPSSTCFLLQRLAEYLPGLVDFIRMSAAPARWGGGPPMRSLCRMARRNGVYVLLGGDCADEFFGGYEHYGRYFADPRIDPTDLGPLIGLDRSSPFYREGDAERYLAGESMLRREILDSLDGIDDRAERLRLATFFHDTATFLQTCNLPHSDAYSMAESVELRNPMLDLDLVRFVCNLPNRWRAAADASGEFGKVLMRRLAEREVGSFIQKRKEGTRNYAMAAADPAFWSFGEFTIRSVVDVPQATNKRQIIRMYNLEIFHRLFFEGCDAPLERVLSQAGKSFCGKALSPDVPASLVYSA
ncbi:MAG: asparagine synthetase B [Alphaproteobacteria bacterium]|nr:MAG: asparagine synthetase B [Alphaproteobacteria bacterium]